MQVFRQFFLQDGLIETEIGREAEKVGVGQIGDGTQFFERANMHLLAPKVIDRFGLMVTQIRVSLQALGRAGVDVDSLYDGRVGSERGEERIEMTSDEIGVGELGWGIVPAQLLAVTDDLHCRIWTNAAQQEQVGCIAMIEVDDRIFLNAFGISPTDGVTPERIGYAERVISGLPYLFPFGTSNRVCGAERVIPLFALRRPLCIAKRVGTTYGVFAFFPTALLG